MGFPTVLQLAAFGAKQGAIRESNQSQLHGAQAIERQSNREAYMHEHFLNTE
jgi:hypothetical protein